MERTKQKPMIQFQFKIHNLESKIWSSDQLNSKPLLAEYELNSFSCLSLFRSNNVLHRIAHNDHKNR